MITHLGTILKGSEGILGYNFSGLILEHFFLIENLKLIIISEYIHRQFCNKLRVAKTKRCTARCANKLCAQQIMRPSKQDNQK